MYRFRCQMPSTPTDSLVTVRSSCEDPQSSGGDAAVTAALDGLRGSCLIGAEWRRGTSGEALVVTDPSDGSAVHEVALASAADVDAAVAAARAAFPGWSRATPGE